MNPNQTQPMYCGGQQNIKALTPREHIRRRPGMYVGGTDSRGFHHMLWEVIDNCIDETHVGYCTDIQIVLHSDTKVSVIDNGRGIPVGKHESGRSNLEIVMTQVGGGYFDTGTYKVTGGLHGVGVSAVNALSSELIAEVKQNGYLWRQTYQEGFVTSEVEKVRPLTDEESNGTIITFTPDSTIMDKGLTFDYECILEHCQERAYLFPEAKFHISNGEDEPVLIHQPGGLSDMVSELNTGYSMVHPVIQTEFEDIYERYNGQFNQIRVSIALQFSLREETIIKSYVNTIEMPDGGTQIEGLKESLILAIYGDNDDELINSLAGLVAVLHIYHPDPQFESTTKVKLLNPEVKDAVMDGVKVLFAENMDIHAQLQGYFRV